MSNSDYPITLPAISLPKIKDQPINQSTPTTSNVQPAGRHPQNQSTIPHQGFNLPSLATLAQPSSLPLHNHILSPNSSYLPNNSQTLPYDISLQGQASGISFTRSDTALNSSQVTGNNSKPDSSNIGKSSQINVTGILPSLNSNSSISNQLSSTQLLANSQGVENAYNLPRPLNVRDALSYLEQVKTQFGSQPEVYNRFLDIMKDFKSQESFSLTRIDTPGVIERVSNLFRSQPRLIIGFNTFLPPGYNLEPTNNPNDPVRVTTPRDMAPHYNQYSRPLSPLPNVNRSQNFMAQEQSSSRDTLQQASESFPLHSDAQNSAIGYTPQMAGASNIITSMNNENSEKNIHISSDPSKSRPPIEFNHAINYVNKIKTRFAHQPETYRYFLEILQTYQREDKPIQEVYTQVQYLFASAQDLLDEFKQFLPDTTPLVGSATQISSTKVPVISVSKKQPKRNPFNQTNYYSQPLVQPLPPKKKVKTTQEIKLSTAEELDFFDKCKRVIGNKTTYNEFLKILNLFTQEIIEAKVLIDRVEPFLGKSPELFDWFKRFVKYDQSDIIYNIPADKPVVDLKSCRQSGHSYRRLPNNIARATCTGKDELSKDVLNDDWVSTPVFISESGFTSHKKNPHEEAMYKCEEERYEFDLNIEANLSVISYFEPVAKKIMLMSADEKASFSLLPGTGCQSATIYKRLIKKIYDVERGLEVIDALHHNPAIAIPIVLKRLKQKDEEWKRSQREWNKVWREIDAKNFSKALDHQGINFKLADRKAIISKTLVNEIEIMQFEQRDTKNDDIYQYQIDFSFKNRTVFKHVHQVLFSCIDNTSTVSSIEEDRIKAVLSKFIPSLLSIINFSDIATSKTSHTGENTNLDDNSTEMRDQPLAIESTRISKVLYCNSSIYSLVRLYQVSYIYQMLYSRLARMDEISRSMGSTRTRNEVKNAVAIELGFRKDNVKSFTEVDRFTELLKDINVFVCNRMEAIDFEDKTRELFWTSGYLVFTVDKLVQAIVRQLQLVVGDSKSLELMTLFSRDQEKEESGQRQEALYRLGAEQIIQNENIYRIEYIHFEKLMTIQLLVKQEQQTDESITAEEKWSLYVDQFVQLSTNSNPEIKRRDPFCRRNLPSHVGEEPPLNVETRSGLELKICVNTYKIFFVDNTEDYFRRKVSPNKVCVDRNSAMPSMQSNYKNARVLKFRKWLESVDGWRADLEQIQCAEMELRFQFLVNGTENVFEDENMSV